MVHDIRNEYVYFNPSKENSENMQIIQNKLDNMKTRLLAKGFSITEQSIPSEQAVNVAAGGLQLVGELEQSDLLDRIGDMLLRSLDKELQDQLANVDVEQMNTIIMKAKGYSDLFKNGSPEALRVNEFFYLIVLAMSEANMLTTDALSALTNIGSKLTGTPFYLPYPDKPYVPVTNADIAQANKVIDTLQRAVNRISNGFLSPRSFAQTIDRIFRYEIADYIIQKSVTNVAGKIVQQADGAFEALANSIPELTLVSSPDRPLERIYGNASVTTLDSPNGLTLTTRLNDNVISVSIAYNGGKLRWATKRGPSTPTTSLLETFESRAPLLSLFKPGSERYAIKNIVVPHRGKAYNTGPGRELARQYVTAFFFQQWADKFKQEGQGDLLLLDNEHRTLVSLYSLFKNALEDEYNKHKRANAVTLPNLDEIHNAWKPYSEDEQFRLDEGKAWERSDETTAALNRIIAACSLNPNLFYT